MATQGDKTLFHDPYHWFPGPMFSTALALVVLGTFLVDWAVPRWLAAHRPRAPVHTGDRCSFRIIQVAGLASIAIAAGARRLDWPWRLRRYSTPGSSSSWRPSPCANGPSSR